MHVALIRSTGSQRLTALRTNFVFSSVCLPVCVQDLSRLLFNRHGGNPREIKANILEFNGFVFADEKAEVRALLFDGCGCLCTQGVSIFCAKNVVG